MDRRHFLRRTGTALGGLALSTAAAPWSKAIAGPCTDFGQYDPAQVWPSALPNDGYKILEIFCAGGMSPWESFYTRAAGDGFRSFQSDLGTVQFSGGNGSDCHPTGPMNGIETEQFAADSEGKAVDLGPWSKPLWIPTIRDRLRVVVMRHGLTPHQVAVPFAIAGKPVGRQGFAHLGSHITRWARERAVDCTLPMPTSYTLGGNDYLAKPRFAAISATGANPAGDRSLVLPYPSSSVISDLARDHSMTAAQLAKTDHLFDVYTEMYRDRLRFPMNNSVPRSRAFARYANTADAMRNWQNLDSFLGSTALAATPPYGARCTSPDQVFPNNTANTYQRLVAAAELLASPDVRHVFVVDSGRGKDYDSHTQSGTQVPLDDGNHVFRASNNVWSLCSAVRHLVDANAIDLDETMIVIKTEFGRSPYREDGGLGRSHWPGGYVNVLIGGPVVPGISGAISDGGAVNTNAGVAVDGHFFSPADLQAALLMTAGVNPFETGVFKRSDMMGSIQSSTDVGAMIHLREQILGVV